MKLFNISEDPYELNNLYKSNLNKSKTIKELLTQLYLERKKIFKLRGVNSLNQLLTNII